MPVAAEVAVAVGVAAAAAAAIVEGKELAELNKSATRAVFFAISRNTDDDGDRKHCGLGNNAGWVVVVEKFFRLRSSKWHLVLALALDISRSTYNRLGNCVWPLSDALVDYCPEKVVYDWSIFPMISMGQSPITNIFVFLMGLHLLT